MKFCISLLLLTALVVMCNAACELPDKKLKSKADSFRNKCLNNGFTSTLHGCESKGANSLSNQQKKTCSQMQDDLESCGYACVETPQCGYIQHSGSKCIHPLGGSATSSAGTNIVTHSGCNEERLFFCKTGAGELRHKTSGLCIVPTTNNPSNNERLMFGECGSTLAKFNLLETGSIQNEVSGKCWHPLGGSGDPVDNNPVVLHDGCGPEDRITFTWHKVDA